MNNRIQYNSIDRLTYLTGMHYNHYNTMRIHDICFQHLQSAKVLAAMPSQCFPMAWEMCGKMGRLVELRQRVGLDSGHLGI